MGRPSQFTCLGSWRAAVLFGVVLSTFTVFLFQHFSIRHSAFLLVNMRWSTLGTAATIILASTTSATSNTQDDLDAIFERRIPFIAESYPVKGGHSAINQLATTINSTGQWPDVDYTSGCPARRANWPAQSHWAHILDLAQAYTDRLPHNGNMNQKSPYAFVRNQTILNAINAGMNYWFENDYTNLACTDQGGASGSACPCSTPGLWNTNWYSNVILVPRLATQTCILLNDTITSSQRANCTRIGLRGYDKFDSDAPYVAGANIMDMASNGVNVGLLEAYGGQMENGTALIADAYRRFHNEVTIQAAPRTDGIKPDGSFSQHQGILYTGNYGKDYANLVLALEISAAGTQWAANSTSQTAFKHFILDGSQWMMYRNTKTETLHWDTSTIGRFISFAIVDNQASASIKMNLTEIEQLGELWDSNGLQKNATRLEGNGTSPNAGNINGNRMFFANDYMVQRGNNYVTTIKMLSDRTKNTECTNSQNPFGFHLGQGARYTYYSGNEYEDIAASWDWNLIPGITTDYVATPLNCANTGFSGLTTFVGGASTGEMGVAAMDYVNPFTKNLRYRKAWFFFNNDVQHVTVAGISPSSPTTPIYSVLDQKRADGPMYVGKSAIASGNFTNATSLWHAGLGYVFAVPSSANGLGQLSVTTANVTGNWSLLGISKQPPTAVNLFKAYLEHDPAKINLGVAYTVYPGTTSLSAFQSTSKSRPISTVQNDANIAAAADLVQNTFMAVFWLQGGSVTTAWSEPGSTLTLSSNVGATVILDVDAWALTVADPTQALTSGVFTVSAKGFPADAGPACLPSNGTIAVSVAFPSGPMVGKSFTRSLC